MSKPTLPDNAQTPIRHEREPTVNLFEGWPHQIQYDNYPQAPHDQPKSETGPALSATLGR